MDIREVVMLAKKAMEEKKAEDIKVLNITGLSPIGDYFVLATGNNRNQMQAMADEVDQELAKVNVHVKQVEGYDNANWILMDYGDFMIHIFNPESRDFYNLERIWRDAKVEE